MPKKGKGGKKDKGKGGKKGKGKGGKKGKEAAADGVIKKFFKTYEKNCSLSSSQMAPNMRKALKMAIEEEKVVTKVSYNQR